ncbi:MAG TPA: YggS family pyridoxal phosphate-dependent enzyme [Gammaproteobacteria bacterium]|nr:YggS family pyridoxal phosphate-dependent enzyme [Gammaproteobacteria bacterium]
MLDVAHNIARLHERIRAAAQNCGRDPGEIALLAASKAQPAAVIEAARATGQRRFGENYLQEALGKMVALNGHDIEWHYIGALQANKTRAVAEQFAWVHTVDRERIARRLSEQRPAALPPLNVCIEVRLSDESGKRGVAAPDTIALAEVVAKLPRLRLRGLMAIPAPVPDATRQRIPFQRLRELRDDLNARGHQLDTLSMGMSADLEAAIAEGSTLLRIGTAIFGPRAAKPG